MRQRATVGMVVFTGMLAGTAGAQERAGVIVARVSPRRCRRP